MSFKKKKLNSVTAAPLTGIVNLEDHRYFKFKKRNSIVSFVSILLVSIAIGFFGFVVLAQVSGLHVSFGLPKFVTRSIPFMNSEPEVEKLNILLTGVGGAGHDGAELTDTIILASINRRTGTVSMLSIPRDLYVEYKLADGQKGRGRINELYARSLKDSNPELAMGELAAKVTQITGEPIDRFLNIDFAGFSRFVDILGGIEVNVPEDIVDYTYPDENWGYQTFRIKKGQQTLDGTTALKYVRSRHSTSDFDRSNRQQLVIAAIKDKLLSMDALTSPSKLSDLYNAVTSHIKTNLSLDELFDLALFSRDLKPGHILSYNLNDGCYQWASFCSAGGFLYTPERELFGGMAVLLAEDSSIGNISDYTTVREFANLIFNYPELYLANEEVTLVNATRQTGLANKVALKLKRFGFNVPEKSSISNTKDSVPKTIIQYVWDPDMKTGLAPDSSTLRGLQLFLNAPTVATGALQYSQLVGPRIEIILGDDAKKLIQ